MTGYMRSDIVLLGSIRDSVDKVKDELKVLGGDEKRYLTALRVMETQAKLVASLSRELINRAEQAGGPSSERLSREVTVHG